MILKSPCVRCHSCVTDFPSLNSFTYVSPPHVCQLCSISLSFVSRVFFDLIFCQFVLRSADIWTPLPDHLCTKPLSVLNTTELLVFCQSASALTRSPATCKSSQRTLLLCAVSGVDIYHLSVYLSAYMSVCLSENFKIRCDNLPLTA